MKRPYESIEGWFNMEKQYRKLLDQVPINGTFVEIGCWKGKSTCFLLEEVIKDGLPREIYVIDNFEGSQNTDTEKKVYENVNRKKLCFEFLDNIKSFNTVLTNLFIQDSAEAASNFAEQSCDVVFIDAGHSYQNVHADILAWLPKVKRGGILAGHDYDESWSGVIQAVNELLGEEHITVENSCWFYKV